MGAGQHPVILLLLADRNMGGVQSTMRSLTQSRLAEHFRFELAAPGEAAREIARLGPRLVIWKDASSWKRLPALAALRLRGSRLAIHEHHYSEQFERHCVAHPGRFRLMLRLAYGLADRVIAISDAQAAWMRAQRLAGADRIAVIHECANIAPLFAVPARNPQKPLVLAAYGRFARQKGFDLLLDAMKQIAPADALLRLAGAGPDEARLREQAAGMEHVEFVGAISDIAGFLAACDAVVIPSRWEPWGLVCQEAKAAGRPVIASGADGLAEQMSGCGMVVPPDDPGAIAAAIREFCDAAPGMLREWGSRGREAVAEAQEQYLRAWERFLKEMTA